MTGDETTFFVEMGARLSKFRRDLGLTQVEVAERLGVSQQTINSFERGRRRVPVSALPAFAKLFSVSVEEIIEGAAVQRALQRGPASKLQRQMEEIRRLPRAKQRMVVDVIEAVLTQAKQQVG